MAANLISYSAAISACREKWQQALQLLARLPELELRINVMLDGCWQTLGICHGICTEICMGHIICIYMCIYYINDDGQACGTSRI